MHSIERATRFSLHTRVKAALLLFTLVLLAGCGGGTNAVQPTPTAPSIAAFTILNLHIPQKAYDAPTLGSVPDGDILHIGVSFKLDQAVLDKINAQKKGTTKDATSLANQLGISDEQYQKVKAYFGVENATLTLGKLHTYLSIDAKASTFARLLQTKFVLHKLDNRTFYTPDTTLPPKLPTAIAGQILAITGLDTYSPPVKVGTTRMNAHTNTAQTTHQPANVCTPDQGYTTQQVAHAYGYDSFWRTGFLGENMTVSLIEINGIPGGSANPNLQTFFNCVGYRGTFSQQQIDGPQPPPPAPGEGDEALLDVDMIAGMAPAANIVDYEMGTNSFRAMNDALQKILSDNASDTGNSGVVSISLGIAETRLADGGQQEMIALDSTLKQIVQIDKMTVFGSSGDCGAFTSGLYNDLSVNFPASDPWIVAVGGTQLRVDANGHRRSEQVWSDGAQDHTTCNNTWGSGGGVSTVFTRPQWQQGPGTNNQYTTGKRQVPDIAAVAIDLNEFAQGQWQPTGGTSAAAPIWAAGLILANQAIIRKTGNGNNGGSYFYSPQIFYSAVSKAGKLHPYYNITNGNNLYYRAGPGWNYPTGWGTPNLVDFANDLYNML